MRKAGRATIKDVAEAAGVSMGTVSRYLNGAHWVSQHAQHAIARAIETTGYTANQSARSLVTGRTNSIAYLLTETSQMLFADPTYALILRGTAVEMARRGLTLVVLVAGTDEERTNVSRYVRAGHVDGVLLISPHEGDPLVRELLDQGVPLVSSGTPLGFEDRAHYVTIDEAEGGALAARRFRTLGRRTVAMIAGPPDTPGGRFRREGFVGEMGDGLRPELIVEGDFGLHSGEDAMRELLRREPAVDAVFAASDAMAVGAITVLREAGRRVPEDVVVIGFDDSGLAADADPPLTTIRQPWEDLTGALVELILDAIDGAPLAHRMLRTRLVQRESC